jgi:hypothetical protein
MKKLAAAALALCVATPALAKKVSGVEFPDTVDVAGQKLFLNGGGVRRKFVVKVYAAALYLPSPSSDPAAIVAADVPKRVRMVFSRDVKKSQVMEAYREGFEKNSAGPGLKGLLAKLETIAPAIPDLRDGSEMSVTYVPGAGTTVEAAGGGKVTVPGKEFADAMFRNWLGDAPADEGLKTSMLGQ